MREFVDWGVGHVCHFCVFLEILTVCNLLCAATFVFADLGLIKACCVPIGRDVTGQGCAGRWVLEGLDCVCVCVCECGCLCGCWCER